MHNSGLLSVPGVSLGTEKLRSFKNKCWLLREGRAEHCLCSRCLSKGNSIKGTMSEHNKIGGGIFLLYSKISQILFKQCCLLGCVFSVLNCFNAVEFLCLGKKVCFFCGVFFLVRAIWAKIFALHYLNFEQ